MTVVMKGCCRVHKKSNVDDKWKKFNGERAQEAALMR